MVPRAGLEPARLSSLPPQDSVSTNSTTWALFLFRLLIPVYIFLNNTRRVVALAHPTPATLVLLHIVYQFHHLGFVFISITHFGLYFSKQHATRGLSCASYTRDTCAPAHRLPIPPLGLCLLAYCS